MTTLTLTPVDAPAEHATPVDTRFGPLYEVRTAGGRIAASVCAREVRTQGATEVVRLASGDTNSGKLEWLDSAGRRVRLADAMAANGHVGKDWDIVPGWSFAPSGARLFAIAGAFPFYMPTHWWSTGRLYEVELSEPARVAEMFAPDARTDEALVAVEALGDDDVLVLSVRALRRLQRGASGWSEVGAARVAHGAEMAVGYVGGTRGAVVRCHDRRASVTKTLVFALAGESPSLLGAVLEPTREVRVHDGAALVRRADDTWHAVNLAEATKPKNKRGSAPKSAAPHPLAGATLELVPCTYTQVPPPVSDAVRAALGARTHSPGAPRMLTPELAVALDQSGALHVLRGGVLQRVAAPDAIRFDVSPTGDRAWIIAGKRVYEGDLAAAVPAEPAPAKVEWREIEVDAAGRWGPDEVARLDDDHLVVKSDKSLELLVRRDAQWQTLHRVAVPSGATLRAWPARACVVLVTASAVRLCVRNGEKLQALHEAKLAAPAGRTTMRPTPIVTVDGELWLTDTAYYHARVVAAADPPAPT